MSEFSESVLAAIGLILLTAAVTHYFPTIRRLVTHRPLVRVHVEENLAYIWAGAPPWVGSAFVFPSGIPSEHPPTNCPDWWQWARNHGGIDAGMTHLRLTFSADSEAAVVFDGLRALVLQESEVPSSSKLVRCTTGGANIEKRHVRIDLDTSRPPMTSFLSEVGTPISSPVLSLTKTQVEVFDVKAFAERQLIDWRIEVLLIVDGKRKVISCDSGGKPFSTCGTETLTESAVRQV